VAHGSPKHAKTTGSTCLPPSEILVAHGRPLYIGNWADVLREMWWLEISDVPQMVITFRVVGSCLLIFLWVKTCSNMFDTTLHVQLSGLKLKNKPLPPLNKYPTTADL